jgi:transcription initiation factor IIE alpha subunit
MSAIERLYSGIFECRDCPSRYDVEDAPEDELFCTDCGGVLKLADDDTETQDDVAEESE